MVAYRMIILQFSFTNAGVIPKVVRRLPKETIEERIARKSYPGGGAMVIEPTENCSLSEFLGELEAAGYELVDAAYEERINAKNLYKTYHMVRFIFVHREFMEFSDEHKRIVRAFMLAELRKICEEAHWRVRAFSNPFFKDGEEVKGQRALSLNFEARKPLFEADDPTRPVRVWVKNEKGERVGDAPLPLRPDYHLRIMEGNVGLVAAP